MYCSIRNLISILVLCLGIIALCAGIVLICLMPGIVRREVEEGVVLKRDSKIISSWSDPPVEALIHFWIFNVTNPNEIIFQGAKPALVQRGPYGFRERLRKSNVTFTSDQTISFSTAKEYFFSPDISCPSCRLEDSFTIPNIPYLTVMKLIRSKSANKGVLDFLGGLFLRIVGEHPFVSDITAGQILFDGYDDQIFQMVGKFKPGLLPEKMGLFYGRNGSADGPYEIKTGVDDISKLGQIVTWEGRKDLDALEWWNPNYTQANMINGTDGGIYPPFISSIDQFPVFSRDICRSLVLTHTKDMDIGGLKAHRFSPPSNVFDSTVNSNRGFCWPSKELYYSEKTQPEMDGGWCLPAGMLDVSKCYNNAPLVMSQPQFLFCPDEVLDTVDGLLPPSEDFVTTIDIEPTTGTVLSASKKLQINVEMYADASKSEVFKNMKAVIVPILWLNETVMLNESTWKYLYENVVSSQSAAYTGSYVAIAGGGVMVIVGAIVLVIMKAKRRRVMAMEKFMPAPMQADPAEAR